MVTLSEVYAKPGELMQGELPGNRPFLLSNKSSRIFKNSTEVGMGSISSEASLAFKSNQAVELFWASFPDNKRLVVDINKLNIKQYGNIPIGKGLSSSSADILGIFTALNLFYKTAYTTEHLYKLAATIEPTDPCLHTCNLSFNQSTGEINYLFELLPYQLIYFDSDEHTQVETVSLSKQVSYSESQHLEYENLCQLILRATADKDYTTFNACLTKSAEMNQLFLPKKNFAILQEFAIKNNAGLFVAHSGTYMGLVVAPGVLEKIHAKAIAFIKRNWSTTIYTE